jgi:hypothetical protein
MTADPNLDCDDGCSGDHKHRWEIEPNPYDSDFDVFVTDKDDEAHEAIQHLATQAWDECQPGEERVIKFRRNKVASDE